MPRPEKVQAVANIKERLEEAGAVFITEYAGLSVVEQSELRRGLRGVAASYRVLKMTLARRAAAELGMDVLEEVLSGPTGLAFTGGDPAPAAKALRDFANDHPQLVIKGVFFDGSLLPPEKVIEFADVEPREVLLAKMAGMLQAPLANLAGALGALPRDAASVFQQLLTQMENGSAAPEASGAEPEADGADAAAGPEDASTEDDPTDDGTDPPPEAEEAD